MEAKAILFHSNKKAECKKFVENENYLIISENSKDNIWLGKGMYFWDNKGNARWWHNKQKERNTNEEYAITVANVKLDELLDLTDYDVYTTLDKLWSILCNNSKAKLDMQLGNKLNVLFEYNGFIKKYAIIKIYGKYNATPNKGFFQYDCYSPKAEPTIAIKCIYNVKDVRCICQKEMEEEE